MSTRSLPLALCLILAAPFAAAASASDGSPYECAPGGILCAMSSLAVSISSGSCSSSGGFTDCTFIVSHYAKASGAGPGQLTRTLFVQNCEGCSPAEGSCAWTLGGCETASGILRIRGWFQPGDTHWCADSWATARGALGALKVTAENEQCVTRPA